MVLRGLMLSLLLVALTASPVFAQSSPTLQDFWEGRASWTLDRLDVGLPVGESDTVYRGDGVYWSYLHASDQSAGIVDQCGEPVTFPGCLTRWESSDGGQSFSLTTPVCAMACTACPCDDVRDHITAQQYPRVFFTGDQAYLAYEWHAQVMLRTSSDGLNWSDWSYLLTPGGTWPTSYSPCTATETIGSHPNIRGQLDNCLVGAPPGLYVEGDTLYVFVAAGSAPGHMRCYKGDRHGSLAKLNRCEHDPLFSGAGEYGPTNITSGAGINPYFDFRYVSSADVLRVGDHYYMVYEGVRGPDILERGMDTQFGLGFARSLGAAIDGEWEKYPANPVLMDVSPNFGVGHADLLVVDGVTIIYTATSDTTRGRYVLHWNE
ncbi:MAG: hypothetical protein K8I30_15445 [Anaerolineae bacterium]|nr:hypothetical protein [Anaerolineae bacterium]